MAVAPASTMVLGPSGYPEGARLGTPFTSEHPRPRTTAMQAHAENSNFFFMSF